MSAAEERAAELAYQAKREAQRAAVQSLVKHRIDGVAPFGPTPADLANQCFSQARGLCVMLETAFISSDNDSDMGVSSLRGSIVAQAFDGIGTLISMGMFALEGGR